MSRVKETARLKGGHKTGGKPSAAMKRKSASALANAAGLRAVKALAAKRKNAVDAEEDEDELPNHEPEAGQDEDEEEEEDGEESGEIEEQESQEAETQMEQHKKRRPRSKVWTVSLPLHPRICPDVIRVSARSARRILKWVVSGIFKTKPMLPTVTNLQRILLPWLIAKH